jgi:protease I
VAAQLEGLKVAVLLERGVNETEFNCSRLRLREAGADVVVVGNARLDYTGETHAHLRADATIDQVDAADFDGVVIPGGLAPEKLRQNPRVVQFVRDLYDRGQVCAAICHGQQVFISAGMLRGRRAVAAWSMVDDLIYTGAQHVPEARAVRDETLVTARFPHDLPQFCRLVLEAFAQVEGRPLPPRFGERLRARRCGIVAEPATDATQLFYTRYRIEEEGGAAPVLSRRSGDVVPLGTPTWEWGEHGVTVTVDQALEDLGAVDSHDFPYEEALRAVGAAQLDGLIVPGGLGTWMIRGHPGLKKLIRQMHASGKPISAIGRGPKVLLSAGILADQNVTCSAETRDDLIAAGLDYLDEPVVRHGPLLFCRGTEDLPHWGRAWMEMWEGGPF